MTRNTLLRSVVGAFLMLGIGFLFILFSSLGNKTSQIEAAAFTDIFEGQTALRRVSGERMWITRLDPMQHKLLQSNHNCKTSKLCAIPARTKVPGIELVFSAKPPPQIIRDMQWKGGFIDPTSSTVFNIGGVAYQLDPNKTLVDLEPVNIE